MSSAAGVPGTRAGSNCKLERGPVYVLPAAGTECGVSSGASEFGDMAGEPTTAPAIAPARSPPVEVIAQQLIAPEAVEAIPELEFDLMANLVAETGHDRLVADSGAHADAEPIPELEFDQTVGW